MNKKELLESFSKLDITSMRREIGKELTETMILLYQYIKDSANLNGEIKLEDFYNLYDGKSTEKEYLTGYYEDFLNFKELLAIYFEKSDNNN